MHVHIYSERERHLDRTLPHSRKQSVLQRTRGHSHPPPPALGAQGGRSTTAMVADSWGLKRQLVPQRRERKAPAHATSCRAYSPAAGSWRQKWRQA